MADITQQLEDLKETLRRERLEKAALSTRVKSAERKAAVAEQIQSDLEGELKAKTEQLATRERAIEEFIRLQEAKGASHAASSVTKPPESGQPASRAIAAEAPKSIPVLQQEGDLIRVLKDQKQQLKAQETKIQDLTSEKDKLVKSLQGVEREQQILLEAKRKVEQVVIKLESSDKDQQQAIKKLNEDKKALEVKLSELQGKIGEMQREIQDLNEQLSIMKKDNEELDKEIEEYRARIDTLSVAKAKAIADGTAMEKKYEELFRSLKEEVLQAAAEKAKFLRDAVAAISSPAKQPPTSREPLYMEELASGVRRVLTFSEEAQSIEPSVAAVSLGSKAVSGVPTTVGRGIAITPAMAKTGKAGAPSVPLARK